jgi:hypothetical protein
MKMPNYVVFDANNTFSNVIVCDEWDILPDGYTKQKLEDRQYWDFETQEIKTIIFPAFPITIETI